MPRKPTGDRPLTAAERQAKRRQRVAANVADQSAELARLRARVAALEALAAQRPPAPEPTPPVAPGRRQRADPGALLKVRELSERLARILAFAPSIEAEAAAWLAQVDAPPAPRSTPDNAVESRSSPQVIAVEHLPKPKTRPRSRISVLVPQDR